MRKALITGITGHALADEEKAFFRENRPAGLILFARNLASLDQISSLVADAKTAAGTADMLVLIDQEGGRVQRLRPPLGRALPPATAYAALYSADPAEACRRAYLAAALVGRDLAALGINANCAPVLDVPVEGAHDIIGDRAYGREPGQVAALGRAVAEGLMAAGVLPIIKHIPGHGRATADSHLDLPVVDTGRRTLSVTDFAAFKLLSDMPAAMTAHVLYSDIDASLPASISLVVTRDIIRGEIGFGGLLMSDDLSMKALQAPIRTSAEAVIAAGSDVALHCNGNLDEMVEAAAGVPALDGPALARFEAALAVTRSGRAFALDEAEMALSAMLLSHTAAVESV